MIILLIYFEIVPPPINETHQQKHRAMYDKIQKLLSEKGIKREPPHVIAPPPSSVSLMSPSTASPFELDPTIPYTPRTNCIYINTYLYINRL